MAPNESVNNPDQKRYHRRKIRTVEHSRGTEGKSLAENQVRI
jgi:hypothetical protein